MKLNKRNKSNRFLSLSGQIVIEYLLLLTISLTIAAALISRMVSRNQEAPGFLILKWNQVIEAIAHDCADDPGPSSSSCSDDFE